MLAVSPFTTSAGVSIGTGSSAGGCVTGVGDSLGTGVGASEAGVVAGGVVGELAPGDPAGRVSASATPATITRAVEAPARMRFRRDVAADGRGGSEVMSLLAGGSGALTLLGHRSAQNPSSS
jgi:hypothetical protein